MKKKIFLMMMLAVSLSISFVACKNKEEVKQEQNAVDYTADVKEARDNLNKSVLDDDTFQTLDKKLSGFEKKDLASLSEKEEKELKALLKEISNYNKASKEAVSDALEAMKVAYPQDASFYDQGYFEEIFYKLGEINKLCKKGDYKTATSIINEINTSMITYVSNKGVTIDENVLQATKIDTKTVATKEHEVAASQSGTVAGNSNVNANSNAGAVANNSQSTNNIPQTNQNAAVGNTQTQTSGNTSNPSNAQQPTTNNKPAAQSQPAPVLEERKPYHCDRCVKTFPAMTHSEYEAHDNQCIAEQDADFQYVTSASNAYSDWCGSDECDASISMDQWLDTHGYNATLYHQKCAKWGW